MLDMVSTVCHSVAHKSMFNPFPDRDIEELYIENSSIWDEVLLGGISPEDALEYMRVDPESLLWDRVHEALLTNNPPL